jgi:SAM-dependent methyltransferase
MLTAVDAVGATKDVLNLGCGRKPNPLAVNVDITAATNPDVVHDLNERPWPFPDDQFNQVQMFDVIEHLDNLVGVMEELHRVCRHGAVIQITTPHFSSANSFTDPTHRHHFGWHTLDYFTGEHEHSYYTAVRFRTRVRSLMFHPSLLNKLIRRLANRWPETYERRWTWVFPAWFLYFELEVLKDQ